MFCSEDISPQLLNNLLSRLPSHRCSLAAHWLHRLISTGAQCHLVVLSLCNPVRLWIYDPAVLSKTFHIEILDSTSF